MPNAGPKRHLPKPAQPALLEPAGIPSLDSEAGLAGAPLAARMRPRSFDDYVGQEHLVGSGKLLRRLIEAGQLPSIILWGPPGSGKTTLARIIAAHASAHFVAISAVSAGVADLRRVVAEARDRRSAHAAATLPPRHPEPVEGPSDSTQDAGFNPRSPSLPSSKQDAGAQPLLRGNEPTRPNAAAGSEQGAGVQPLPEGEGDAPLQPPTNESAAAAETAGPERRDSAGTILFIDEIHRFNKAQQDAVLPYVEDGTITLIGATTENPSFEVIGPLLSRSRVFTLKALTDDQLAAIIRRALTDPTRGLASLNVVMDENAIAALAASVGGDARIALNALEAAALSVSPTSETQGAGAAPLPGVKGGVPLKSPNKRSSGAADSAGPEREGADRQATRPKAVMRSAAEHPEGVRHVTRSDIEEALQHRTYLYDQHGDAHYDTISAFIKSLRGSDPDASLYWLARMIEAGEDPLFIVRRMVILAAEDIGLADPNALVIATACQQAVHFIGMPEGHLPMAETTLYLALAPKSNDALTAYQRALADVEATRNDPVPMHLRNAVTGLMHQLGYGQGYKYAHNYEGNIAPNQTYLPDRLQGHRYYDPKRGRPDVTP